MARDAKFDRALRDFEKKLFALVDKKTIHRHLADHYGKEIVQAIIGAAAAGIGPDDAPFTPWSPAYKAKKEKAGHSRFMRGIENTGKTGGMLDPKRFAFEIDSQGRLFIVWTAANDEMAVYAEVHQEGLQIGRFGPRIQRRWMHLESAKATKAVVTAYRLTIQDLSAQVAAGNMPR